MVFKDVHPGGISLPTPCFFLALPTPPTRPPCTWIRRWHLCCMQRMWTPTSSLLGLHLPSCSQDVQSRGHQLDIPADYCHRSLRRENERVFTSQRLLSSLLLLFAHVSLQTFQWSGIFGSGAPEVSCFISSTPHVLQFNLASWQPHFTTCFSDSWCSSHWSQICINI